jgi:ABC-type uncharacterized transport system, permease component
MRLLFKYFRVVVRGQLRYRSTLFLNAFGQLVLPLTMLAGIQLLFARFGSLAGWTAPEVLLCFGVTHCAFSLSELAFRGFDSFSTILANGEFDRILVRPTSPTLQVLGSRLEISRVGRLAVGIAVLAWAIAGLGIRWSFLKALTIALMVLCGAALFSGIFTLGAALAFLTMDGLEIVNVLTDGGRELAQYPISIYGDKMVRFFTFAVPFACVNYLPLLYILDRGGGPASALLPLAGLAFLPPCLAVWRLGARRYVSTGS